jgi:hypothetical protein
MGQCAPALVLLADLRRNLDEYLGNICKVAQKITAYVVGLHLSSVLEILETV